MCRIRFVSEDINRIELSCTHRPLALWGLSVFCPTCIYQALRALHPGGIVATETTLVASTSQVANHCHHSEKRDHSALQYVLPRK